MIEILIEAGVMFGMIAGLAYMAGLGIAHVVEQRVLASLRSGVLDERMQRLSLLAAKFKARRDKMLPALVRLDAQVKSVRRRQYMVQKRVADLSVSRSSLVRMLGEEEAFQRTERPSRRFVALVINRHVQRAQLEQKEHPNLARSWSRPQAVHAWAPTIGDAKALVERAFPPATGFFIIEVAEQVDDAQVLADMEAAAVVPPLRMQG